METLDIAGNLLLDSLSIFPLKTRKPLMLTAPKTPRSQDEALQKFQRNNSSCNIFLLGPCLGLVHSIREIHPQFEFVDFYLGHYLASVHC